jgi:protein O-mannosyl-transferase
MSSSAKRKKAKAARSNNTVRQLPDRKKPDRLQKKIPFGWIFIALAITAVCVSPMLRNGFTNWDDWDYVTNNPKLQETDWKEIFTGPFVGNYHPLTMFTLAINFRLSQLDATPYLLVNYALHLFNTVLVFFFIWQLSGGKKWVAFVTALVFGIHPMHVESVAWISERKDVLYSFFFLLGLIKYHNYVRDAKRSGYWLSLIFFSLSILSKPAAIVFPFVLFLLDYWSGRPWNKKLLLEKLPFFLISLLFAVITFSIQSKSAVVTLQSYPLWSRPLFGCYVLMIYFLRFFVPYPLSNFHPYPSTAHLPLEIILSPFFVIALFGFLWLKRKNKIIVFGLSFFIINLLLVLQVVAIGSSLVSERYTYIPYIGLAFCICMLLAEVNIKLSKTINWALPLSVSVVFGSMTFERTKVWKDSNSLWSDAIEKYPDEPLPRTNRANYNIMLAINSTDKPRADSLYQYALEDCNVALIAKPDDVTAYENRQNVYLNTGRDKEALLDANALIKLAPSNKTGYFTRGVIYMRSNQLEKALADFNKTISIDPNIHYAYSYRGLLFLNYFQKYLEASEDFSKAIELNPSQGFYYYNRSLCYFHLGDKTKARADALIAAQLGMTFPEDYKKSLNF